MSTPKRDPRVDPMPGDVLRKWDQRFTVESNCMGLVRTVFPREWVQGILDFRRWANDAEVLYAANE